MTHALHVCAEKMIGYQKSITATVKIYSLKRDCLRFKLYGIKVNGIYKVHQKILKIIKYFVFKLQMEEVGLYFKEELMAVKISFKTGIITKWFWSTSKWILVGQWKHFYHVFTRFISERKRVENRSNEFKKNLQIC